MRGSAWYPGKNRRRPTPGRSPPPRRPLAGRDLSIATTTRLVEKAGLLRLRLKRSTAGIDHDSDVLIGQIIAIANESFRRELGVLDTDLMRELERRLRIVLDL